MMTIWVFTYLVAATATMTVVMAGPQRGRALKACPSGYQAVVVDGKQDCVCDEFHVYWPATGLCYPEFSRGPCGIGQHLVANGSGHVECKCPGFFAPYKDENCYQEYSLGPCELGKLFMSNAKGEGICSCSAQHVMHYFQSNGLCYALYDQGPCPDGHLLKFDYRTLKPTCECRDGHMLEEDGICYELNTAGPCNQSACSNNGINCYLRNLDTLKTDCKCLPGNVTTAEGRCFEPYSRGPCPLGQWLVFSHPSVATCQSKTQCTRFDNWFYWASEERCYRQYSQGPCPKGQLFYLDPNTGVAMCECRKEWNPYYWHSDGKCYEQHSIGPCAVGRYFGFNKTSGQTECNCFESHVMDKESDTCYERNTKAMCPDGKLVTADPKTGALKCDCHSGMADHFWASDSKCYQHYQEGPCPTGQTFRLDMASNKPACITWG